MDLDQYQSDARKTDSVPHLKGGHEKLHFLLHGLVDEVGQFASLIKKCMRQDIDISEQKAELVSRLGDALWYVAAIASYLDVPLSECLSENILNPVNRL
jgi:NTP pyrophosphatase (non-canonical NTP hydrolase)